jgi:hypothetical protein
VRLASHVALVRVTLTASGCRCCGALCRAKVGRRRAGKADSWLSPSSKIRADR